MSDRLFLLVRDYLRGAAVLYGAMPLSTLYAIFSQHEGEGMPAHQFYAMAREAQGPGEPFRIIGDDDIYRGDIPVAEGERRVIHRQYCYATWDGLFALECAQQGKAPRIFSREELLAYAAPNHIPDTPQIRELWEIMAQATTGEVPLPRIMVQALALAIDDWDGAAFLKEMQQLGCCFGSVENRRAAMTCYWRVWETVPKPIHNGHSERELGQRQPLPFHDLWFCPPSAKDPFALTEQQLMQNYPIRGTTDYQRFLDRCMAQPALPPRLLEPCFCGSGLDYADCCGKR